MDVELDSHSASAVSLPAAARRLFLCPPSSSLSMITPLPQTPAAALAMTTSAAPRRRRTPALTADDVSLPPPAAPDAASSSAPSSSPSAAPHHTVSTAAAEVMHEAEAASRAFCAPLPLPPPPPPRRVIVAARNFAHARELRRERTSPRVRLSLALVILAGVFAAGVWREESVRAIDAPTVRVDLPAGHALRGYNAARASAEVAAELAVPLHAGGARAISAAHAGGDDAAVLSPSLSLAPSAQRAGSVALKPGVHDTVVWRQMSAQLLDAAIATAIDDCDRVAARAAVVRALGDRGILSVIDAEHGIFSLDAACVITTHLSTFETRGNAVVVCAVSVALHNLDFAASVALRKTLRLALPHHMPSAHLLFIIMFMLKIECSYKVQPSLSGALNSGSAVMQ